MAGSYLYSGPDAARHSGPSVGSIVAGETRSEGEENADFDTALEELLKGESNEGDENPSS